MGALFRFTCDGCGYGARVSGGLDIGFEAVVRTMTCLDCRDLVDVLVGRGGVEGATGDPEYDRRLHVCPECEGPNLLAWLEEWPCPRCEGRMSRSEGAEILWD